MARKLKGTQPLSKQITLRVTASLAADVAKDAACAGRSDTDYLRLLIENRNGVVTINALPPKMSPDHRENIRYFKATSNNMNQLAKRAHESSHAGTLNDAIYVNFLESLQGIEMLLSTALI